ncbi:MAG: Ig-like domain-containing protein [Candidatus Shapirobacteria bacterium]|nr:Ig-like domain-containing protein [Candidatus Shapirobacteria bacterium]
MEKNAKLKMKRVKPVLIAVGVVAGILLILFLATSVVPRALVTLTRASSSGNVVVGGSYLLGEEILARADGKDACVVNVFLQDKNGQGVEGKTVELTGMTNGVEPVNTLSDKNGKVSFKLTSTIEGQFKINAVYGGSQLPQTIVVTFRN